MKSRDWTLTLSMSCTITWPFLLMTTYLDQIRCVLQVDHSKGAISCQLMNSTRCGLFVTFPKIIAFAGRHFSCVYFIGNKYFFSSNCKAVSTQWSGTLEHLAKFNSTKFVDNSNHVGRTASTSFNFILKF